LLVVQTKSHIIFQLKGHKVNFKNFWKKHV